MSPRNPAAASAPPRVLDIRPSAAFRAGHLPGAVGRPVTSPPPGASATEHFNAAVPSIFLPPREVPLLVVADDGALATALAAHLEGRGRVPVTGCTPADLPPGALAERGDAGRHLWEPPAFLAAHADLLPPPALGPVLDLACGSGRAAVWLAARGYRVTAVDWQPEALAFGRLLAADLGVEVAWVAADLRRPAAVPSGPWAVVLDFRFLERGLLARLPDLLLPGGVACVRTFRAAPGYDGHPHPRHRLAPGELLGAFPTATCEILVHEESHDPDGRPAAGVVARRLRRCGSAT